MRGSVLQNFLTMNFEIFMTTFFPPTDGVCCSRRSAFRRAVNVPRLFRCWFFIMPQELNIHMMIYWVIGENSFVRQIPYSGSRCTSNPYNVMQCNQKQTKCVIVNHCLWTALSHFWVQYLLSNTTLPWYGDVRIVRLNNGSNIIGGDSLLSDANDFCVSHPMWFDSQQKIRTVNCWQTTMWLLAFPTSKCHIHHRKVCIN